MVAKRKRLEQLTQNSLKNTNKKVEDIWTTQKNERFVREDFLRLFCFMINYHTFIFRFCDHLMIY